MISRRLGTASLVRQLGAWGASGTSGPAYRRLAERLRLLILDGRLPLNVRIPGEREVATTLGVSRTTVGAAFALLRDEGYLISRQGAGSWTSVPETPSVRAMPMAASIDTGVIDLAVAALPATPGVHHAYAEALAALPRYLPGHGYEPVGLDVLCAAIAERYTRRGCPTTPDQIMVTHGAQHGLALLLRAFAGPGDRILIDHPTYPHAIDAIQCAAARPIPIGLPSKGWDLDAVAAAVRQTSPRLAYLIADFHNPTGRCMDEAARRELAGLAARTRTMLVVDETMADLWLDARPPAPVAAHDRDGWVVSLGSTGKSFWGGLRVGWIRADTRSIAVLARTRASLDLGTPVVEQLAAARLIADDSADLDLRRAQLRVQRAALVRLVDEHLPDWRLSIPPGGLSIWAELPEPVSTALAATAEAEGVRISAGPRFGVDGAFERFVRLPFSLPEEMLEIAIVRLATAYRRLRPPVTPRNPARQEFVDAVI